MSRISVLEENIKQVSKFLKEDEERLKKEPEDLFFRVSYESNKYDLLQLQKKLKEEKEKRYIEVLDLRFIGNDMERGSIPLRLLSKISDFFSAAILSSSNKYLYGRDKARFSKDLLQIVDLRLSDIAYGSTRLIVTGNTSPDLMGYSVLEEVLKNLFTLFHAYDNQEEYSDKFEDYLHNFGQRGVKNLLNFLNLLVHDGIEIEMSWDDPGNYLNVWRGNKFKLAKIYNHLASAELRDPEIVNIWGKVKLLSESGRILLTNSDDNKTTSIKFSQSQYMQVQQLTLGQLVCVECEKQKMFNTQTNTYKDYFSFIEIKSPQ